MLSRNLEQGLNPFLDNRAKFIYEGEPEDNYQGRTVGSKGK